MSTRTLPPNLYTRIFTHLAPSPSLLRPVLRCSSLFYKLAKPILYRHITISTKRQRSKLAKMSKTEMALVKHVTIIGDGPISDFDTHCGNFSNYETCKLGSDCVEDLLKGKLLDISVIETLHVRNIHESPESGSPWEPPYIKFKTASKLSELSVWGHQGGLIIWRSFLDPEKKKIPQLRRLGFANVTRWSREVLEYDSQGLHLYSTPEEEQSNLGKDVPYPQLEVLVTTPSSDLSNLTKFPHDKYLAHLSLTDKTNSWEYVFSKYKYISLAPPYVPTDDDDESVDEMEDEFSDFLLQLSQNPKSVKFLSIPLYFVEEAPVKCHQQIEGLRLKGIEVYIEEEEDSSLVSSRFVDYLKRTEGSKGEV